MQMIAITIRLNKKDEKLFNELKENTGLASNTSVLRYAIKKAADKLPMKEESIK